MRIKYAVRTSIYAPDAYLIDWEIPGTVTIVTPAAVESPAWSI